MPVLHSLRTDLEFSRQSHQDQSFTVVKDPATNKYFRFTETQAAILDCLRTPVDLEALGAAVADRLGAAVNPASLEAFLESLDRKMLLDTPSTQVQLQELRERKPEEAQNILYLRLFSLDAEKAFDWLFPKVKWCFTPLFHVFAVAMILTGFTITTLHSEDLVAQFLNLLSVYGILMVWAVVLLVTGMHEFAHGLTCRYFGGRVRRIGFMLIYCSPALYCDVSDAWMFPEKRKRVWVTFAGGYFQLVVWGIATIVWRVVDTGTLISNLALSAILFGGVQTLFNLNPLIKLDGYYMLSDYLEIPNLREKSFQALKAWLAAERDPLLDGRERRPLLAYSALAMSFSTLLLAVVYVNIYWLATSYFAFAGLVAFAVFSGFTLKRAAAEPAAGARALVTRAVLKKYRSLAIAAVLILLTLLPWELRIAADFEILPNEEAVIRAETAGTISEILVREGSHVEKGDLIARLFDFEKERELSTVTGEIDQKRAELALLEAGPRAEEINQAQRLVETRRTELANVRRNIQERNRLMAELDAKRGELRLAELEFERAEALFNEGLGPRYDVDLTAEAVNVRESEVAATETAIEVLAEATDREADLKQRELEEAEGALTLLRAGFRTEEIDQRRAELAALERRQRILEEELEKSRILATISGTVVTPFIERNVNRRLEAGDELGRIVALDTVEAELAVPEKEMADVEAGSRVVLKARAYPARDFEGRVDTIAPVAQIIEGDRVVDVRTRLENSDGALRPEMTGVAKIYAGRRLVIQLITRRIVRWIRTEFWDILP